MLDPVSVFVCMWVLNAGLPNGRLAVKEVIETKENIIIVDSIIKSIIIREGL